MKRYLLLIIMTMLLSGCGSTGSHDNRTMSSSKAKECTDKNSCLDLINKKISSNWRIPPNFRDGMWAKVNIIIDKDYNVSGVYFIENHGDMVFSNSIEVAILKSSPFSILSNIEDENKESLSEIALIFNPSLVSLEFNINDPSYELYQKGMYFLKSKQFNEAIKQFQYVYEKYPGSKYGINGQYWLGELYLSRNNLIEAKKSFEIISDEKGSIKRPEALYKLGKISELYDDMDGAKIYYSKILNEYNGSAIAKLTKEHMEKIGLDVN